VSTSGDRHQGGTRVLYFDVQSFKVTLGAYIRWKIPKFMEEGEFIDEKGPFYYSALFDTHWGDGYFFCSNGD
jgi:hypothetical protein